MTEGVLALAGTSLAAGALGAALLAAVRLLRGPGSADRVVALDIFLAAAIALCVAAALITGRAEFLDVGAVLALVSFVGTLAWARLVERSARGPGGGDP